MQAEEPVSDGMKGATPDARRHALADYLTSPANHFAGRPAREGEQQDATRNHAVADQDSHTSRQGLGLAGAGTRDHQQRSGNMLGSRALVGIQSSQEGSLTEA